MDHLDQVRVLFGVGFQKVGIVGLQLGRQVRVANLEPYGEAAIALQRAAFVVAFQSLVTFRFTRAQDVAQFDRSAALHLLHGRSQLCRCEPTVVLAKVVTGSVLLPVAAFTGDFHRLFAGQIRRAFAVMARRLALVGTAGPWGGAVLLADFPFGEAFVLMTGFDALVPSAG